MVVDPYPEPPRPPVANPEPDPKALGDDVDWMTYSHQQLYDMVHNGMDLSGAGAVADSWASLSNTLNELGDELNSAVAASADGWQGTAADKARESLASLVGWLRSTGDGAVEVSGCVSRQVAAADTARSTMPAPVQRPVMQPMEQAVPGAGTAGTGVFTAGAGIVRPPLDSEWQAQEAHQRAAQVMRQYQTTSYDIFRTVPEFAPPTGRASFGDRHPQPAPPPRQPAPAPPGPAEPLLAAPVGTASPRTVGPRSGGAPIDEGEPALGSGAESGTGSGSGTAAPAGAERAATAGRPAGQPMTGGLGGAEARRNEDKERRTPRYLEEDERIFGIEDRTAPPVIGE